MDRSGMDVKAIAAITHLSKQEIGGIMKEGNA
jgi:hypothetical protein